MKTCALLLTLSLALTPWLAEAQEPVPSTELAASAKGKIVCKEKIKVLLATKDAQNIDATLLSLDAKGVDYQEKSPIDGEVKGRVAWPLLSVAAANAVLKAGIDSKNAEQLIFAGRVLQSLPDGVKEAGQWYALAVKADANAKAQVEVAKKAEPLFPPVLEAGKVTQSLPRSNPQAWPAESGGSMRAAVGEAVMKASRILADEKMHVSMNQNDLFILYSDLPPADTKKWASRFGNIYIGMAKAFGMDSRTNVWHGKASVFLFKSREEYIRYTAAAYRFDVGASSGYCVSGGDGAVSILMYEDAQNTDLEYVLYHEFSHGFFSRYQSRIWVKSWANEGLAEFMANRFTRANHSETWRATSSIAALKQAKSFEDFFAAEHIQGKHYGVAGDITRMLVECDPKRYGAFLGWLKYGADADTALRNSYGMDVEGLVKAYAKRIGCPGLKSH